MKEKNELYYLKRIYWTLNTASWSVIIVSVLSLYFLLKALVVMLNG